MTTSALLLAAALVVAPGATTGEPAAVDLVTGSTGSTRLEVPYPGHSTAFDVTAHPTAGAGPTDLTLLLDGATGLLAEGPDALRLTLTGPAGAVLAEGTAAELLGRPVPLGTLDEQPVTVRGAAALPASAGDAVQGAGLSLTFRLVATGDAARTTRSAVLATTGVHAPALAAAAAVLLATGLLLAVRRRPTEDS